MKERNTTSRYSTWAKYSSFFILTLRVYNVLGFSPIEIIYDSSHNLHRCLDYHPEQPNRIDACIQRLKKYQEEHTDSGFHILDVSPSTKHEHNDTLSDDELLRARSILTKTHSEKYVSNVEQKCKLSREKRMEDGKPPLGFIGYIDPDTYLTTESYDVFLRATAIWIRAVEKVSKQKISNASNGICSSMALTRPPGHHATKELANGFCVFNFAAAAALFAIEQGLAKRVSILDWDVHYGQGVADIIQHEENIRYVSMHQCPGFPYMGEELRVQGVHKNIYTIPILAGMTWETGYSNIFTDMALPFIYSEKDDAFTIGGKWIPDLVIVCAGYDALSADELASVNLNPSDFGQMIKLIRERIIDKDHHVGLMLGLEGGYQLRLEESGMAAAVLNTILALSN